MLISPSGQEVRDGSNIAGVGYRNCRDGVPVLAVLADGVDLVGGQLACF